jgi:hypothetical protein
VYDFVVVDEVQDLDHRATGAGAQNTGQAGAVFAVWRCQPDRAPQLFLVVAVKTLFWQDEALARAQTISVLRANFRNAQAVTTLANQLLKIKHARFGSIDRETNFLVQSCASQSGSVQLLADKDATRRELNTKTRGSTQFAVLVLRDEDKAAVRQQFQTPLVFSVHEAKGLEYPNVIMVDMVSGQRQAFAELAQGVQTEDLRGDDTGLPPRQRQDRPHAGTVQVLRQRPVRRHYPRGGKPVCWVESDTRHPLLQLLELQTADALTLAQAGLQPAGVGAGGAPPGAAGQAGAGRCHPPQRAQNPKTRLAGVGRSRRARAAAQSPGARGQISNKPRQACWTTPCGTAKAAGFTIGGQQPL